MKFDPGTKRNEDVPWVNELSYKLDNLISTEKYLIQIIFLPAPSMIIFVASMYQGVNNCYIMTDKDANELR